MSARKPASKKAAPPGDGIEAILAGMRAALVEHVGGQPTATQNILIQRACWSQLHLRLLDEKGALGTPLTAPDRAAFISLSGVLIAALDGLGPPAGGGRLIETKQVERIVIDPGGPTARDIIAGRLNRLGREAVEEDGPALNSIAADALPGAALLPPATELVAPAPLPDTVMQGADDLESVAVLPDQLVALLDQHAARDVNNRRAAPDQWGPNPVLDYVDYRW
jgi:hypothetical protein